MGRTRPDMHVVAILRCGVLWTFSCLCRCLRWHALASNSSWCSNVCRNSCLLLCWQGLLFPAPEPQEEGKGRHREDCYGDAHYNGDDDFVAAA